MAQTLHRTLARRVGAPRRRGERLVGLDVARCLALLGMVSTHVLSPVTPEGEISWTQDLAGGRASALFAVLAGVSLALLSGRRTPPTGRARWAAVRALGVRALLIAALGLTLGMLDSGLAVILTYYGVMFLLALPFIGLGARSLAMLAAVWMV
ncbi:MAG: heparan-alpha-glucosaminide N-acetyltransferase domain-containing protein, partial [Nocardioides sp.]